MFNNLALTCLKNSEPERALASIDETFAILDMGTKKPL